MNNRGTGTTVNSLIKWFGTTHNIAIDKYNMRMLLEQLGYYWGETLSVGKVKPFEDLGDEVRSFVLEMSHFFQICYQPIEGSISDYDGLFENIGLLVFLSG